MCGIVGIASKFPQVDRLWLARSRDGLVHRGPDDAGEWWSEDGKVSLAHRRLAILDLTAAGHEPKHWGKPPLTIVFNGEIYNFLELRKELEDLGYSFRSRTDTEVLLAAYAHWGMDCLSRLNGMFVFAIYDQLKRRVFLARDRAGEKPLFCRLNKGSLYFASELKALLSHPDLPRQIDRDSLGCYLAYGFAPGERCILKGYNKLPPAHAMIFDLEKGRANVWRYWELPSPPPDGHERGVSAEQLSEELEALLEDSVQRQLIADVPVGILLSGGIDSSLITAMAAQTSSKVKTFTIGFPGAGPLDEREHARLIANYFGTEHLELDAEDNSSELIPLLARQYDEPVIDSSMIPTFMVSRLVRQYCKVALGGDGGDELFGGYGHYPRLLWMERHLRYVPQRLKRALSRFAERRLPVGLKGRNWIQGLEHSHGNGLPLIASYFSMSARKQLLPNLNNSTLAECIFQQRIPQAADIIQRATRMDFYNYLPEDILVKVDRASMLTSLEVRAPFLDYRIIEFAYGKVPSHFKATGEEKKILPKKLASKILPPEFDKKRKQGFSIPMVNWLKRGLFRELFWDTLMSKNCMFDRQEVQHLLRNQDKGYSNGERLFGLVMFELWRREYGVSLDA